MLFLILYVDIVRPNIDNLVTLCIDQIDTDRLALKRRIEDSLGRLENQNLINHGDLYFFLTNEEQDVSREIKAVDVAVSEVNKLLAEILFEECLNGQTKVRYKPTKTDYDFNRLCDAVPYKQAAQALTLEIVTPLNDDYDGFGEPRCLVRSTEGPGSALIRLGDDKSLGADLRVWLQTDKYVRLKNDASAPPLLRRILSDRAEENRERRQRLKAVLTRLLVEGDAYVLGQKPVLKASVPTALLDEALAYLIAAPEAQAEGRGPHQHPADRPRIEGCRRFGGRRLGAHPQGDPEAARDFRRNWRFNGWRWFGRRRESP